MSTPPGRTERPTIADVAKLAGVSRGAVSQVFNGRGSISVATQDRIRAAAAKLQWTPSPAAVALRSSRARTIGLALHRGESAHDLGNASVNLIAGIESVLSPRDYGLLMHVFDSSSSHETRAYRELSNTRRVDGVILTDSRIGDDRFAVLRELGMPAVLVGAPWDDDPIPHLDTDKIDVGLRDAVQHLVDLGHRRLAYIDGPLDRVQSTRGRATFSSVCSEHDLPPAVFLSSDYSAREATQHTIDLLRSRDAPTAIVYGTDLMALSGMKVVRSLGLSVPEDVSIVGYDGLSVGELVEPELSTVRRSTMVRGRAAALALLALLGEEVTEDRPATMTEFIARRSTAPPPP